MKQLKRNKKTGILEIWENKKKIGEISTLGDDVKGKKKDGRKK